jgi:hypothetical protein
VPSSQVPLFQSTRIFPPVGISWANPTTNTGADNINSWAATISGAAYGNGNYIITSSTYWPDTQYTPWRVFSRPAPVSGAGWAGARYSAGIFRNEFKTAQYTLDGSFYGEWLRLQLPNAIILTRTEFTPRMSPWPFDERLPGQFKIYGSNDGTKWNVLHHQATALISNAGAPISVTIAAGRAYSHIAFVAASLSKPSGAYADALNFVQWDIYGLVTFMFIFRVHAISISACSEIICVIRGYTGLLWLNMHSCAPSERTEFNVLSFLLVSFRVANLKICGQTWSPLT